MGQLIASSSSSVVKMSASIAGELPAKALSSDYDRSKELKAFDDTNAGVKGLVDAGIVNIPKIFIRPPEELVEELIPCQTDIQVPIIDFNDIQTSHRRKEIVDEVRMASEKWGFFQVVNHEIPVSVLNEMIDGICMFNEQEVEEKKKFYTRDVMKKVRFNSNYDLHKSRTANWRDTLSISMPSSDLFDPEELPAICSKATLEYAQHIKKLAVTLFELLSEGLGLKADHLSSMGCAEGFHFSCHYYPACPEPELTLGASRHSDPAFLTIVLQSQISGLQVLHEGQWFAVNPIPGGLVVNIGDFLQILSNDKLKSIEHRVLASHVGPRISVACFLPGAFASRTKPYGPVKELTSEEHPARYKEFLLSEYMARFLSRSLDEKSGIDYYRI